MQMQLFSLRTAERGRSAGVPLCAAGFKFVPAYAEIAADLVEKGQTDLKSDFLRIGRLLPGTKAP